MPERRNQTMAMPLLIKRASDAGIKILHSTPMERSVSCEIQGSTGNLYQVEISDQQITCSCPDWTFRGRRQFGLCKHIVRVILDLTADTPFLLKLCQQHVDYSEWISLAKKQVQPSTETPVLLETTPRLLDATCIFCLSDMDGQEVLFCSACARPFHTDCAQDYASISMVCPCCRQVSQLKHGLFPHVPEETKEPRYSVLPLCLDHYMTLKLLGRIGMLPGNKLTANAYRWKKTLTSPGFVYAKKIRRIPCTTGRARKATYYTIRTRN